MLDDEFVISIQPICLIEENAKIILIDEMLNCDKDPIIKDIILIIIRISEEFIIIILMGIIFWYLIRTMELFHFNLLIILGNHIWNGDIAIFKAITRMMIIINKFIWMNFLYSIFVLLFENIINIMVDAIAWMRKYFNIFSFWFSHIIRDIMKDIDVSSNKIQIISQELDDIAKIGGVNSIIITKFFFINKECFIYLWIMNSLA